MTKLLKTLWRKSGGSRGDGDVKPLKSFGGSWRKLIGGSRLYILYRSGASAAARLGAGRTATAPSVGRAA